MMRSNSYSGRQQITDAMADKAIRQTASRGQPSGSEPPFRLGDSVVYAAHGVGRIEKIGMQDVGQHSLQMIQVSFATNHMTLRIPAATARASGLRQVASQTAVDEALAIIVGAPRAQRGLWARRSKELQEKISSGQIVQVAEVVRDLRHHLTKEQGSFSERQLFQTAFERLTDEVALSMDGDGVAAADRLTALLKQADAPGTAVAVMDEVAPTDEVAVEA